MSSQGSPASHPSVSVVIPTYNCAHLLPRAIESAYAQTFAPCEVVVVNDGCTDHTDEVIQQLIPTLPSSFVYDKKANGGEASARNRGVALAKGEFVAFLDQDDAWLHDKLERQMAMFNADVALALSFTAYTRISDSGKDLVCLPEWNPEPDEALKKLLMRCWITPSTVVVRSDVLRKVGPFDESLWLGNDWDMWLRIAAAGHRTAYLPVPLTDYYWHGTNMSQDLRLVGQAANVIFPRLFKAKVLPPSIQRLERKCCAGHSIFEACCHMDIGDMRATRRCILRAVKMSPASVRPGWLLMFLRSLIPSQRLRPTGVAKEMMDAE